MRLAVAIGVLRSCQSIRRIIEVANDASPQKKCFYVVFRDDVWEKGVAVRSERLPDEQEYACSPLQDSFNRRRFAESHGGEKNLDFLVGQAKR